METLPVWITFFAQFLSVFALVLNSKLMRDDRWVLAMLNSWFISATQFVFIWVVAQTGDPVSTFLYSAAGGSLGSGASHLFYTKFVFARWSGKPVTKANERLPRLWPSEHVMRPKAGVISSDQKPPRPQR